MQHAPTEPARRLLVWGAAAVKEALQVAVPLEPRVSLCAYGVRRCLEAQALAPHPEPVSELERLDGAGERRGHSGAAAVWRVRSDRARHAHIDIGFQLKRGQDLAQGSGTWM